MRWLYPPTFCKISITCSRPQIQLLFACLKLKAALLVSGTKAWTTVSLPSLFSLTFPAISFRRPLITPLPEFHMAPWKEGKPFRNYKHIQLGQTSNRGCYLCGMAYKDIHTWYLKGIVFWLFGRALFTIFEVILAQHIWFVCTQICWYMCLCMWWDTSLSPENALKRSYVFDYSTRQHPRSMETPVKPATMQSVIVWC